MGIYLRPENRVKTVDDVRDLSKEIETPSAPVKTVAGGGNQVEESGADSGAAGSAGSGVASTVVVKPENEVTVASTAAPTANMTSRPASSMTKEEASRGLESASKGASTTASTKTSDKLVPAVEADKVGSSGSAGVEEAAGNQLINNALKNSSYHAKQAKPVKKGVDLRGTVKAEENPNVDQKPQTRKPRKQPMKGSRPPQVYVQPKENQAKGVYVKEGDFLNGAKKMDPFNMDAARRALIYPAIDENGNRVVNEDDMWQAWEDYARKSYKASRAQKQGADGKDRLYNSNLDNSAEYGTREDHEKRYLPPDVLGGNVVYEGAFNAQGEFYARDEDTVDPSEIGASEKKMRAFEKARNKTAALIARPETLRIEGDRLVRYWAEKSDGTKKKTQAYTIRHSPEVQKLINTIRRSYNCSEHAALSMFVYAGSIGYDNNGNLIGKSGEEFRLSYEDMRKLTHQMLASQNKYGHPFGVADSYCYIGNTRCYPCGYVDKFTLQELSRSERSPLHGRSIEELQADIKETWDKYTLKDLMLSTHKAKKGSKEYAQREAVINFLRGAMTLDERYDYALYGVTMNCDNKTFKEVYDELYQEELDSMGDGVSKNEALRAAAVKSSRMVAQMATDKARRENARHAHANHFVQRIQGYTTLIRFFGTLRIELVVSNFAEKVLGNGLMSLAERGYKAFNEKHALSKGVSKVVVDNATRLFSVTDELKDLFDSQEAEDTIKCFLLVANSAGPNALPAYNEMAGAAVGDPRKTVAWLSTFISEHQEDVDEDGRPKFLPNMAQKLSSITEAIMTGNGMTNRMDAQAFVRNYLNSMEGTYLGNHVNPEEAEAFMTNDGLVQSIQAQSLPKVMAQMVTTHQGMEAFRSLNQMNSNRMTPTKAVVHQFLKDHSITEGVFCTFVDKYPEFGLGQLEVWLPMSSTMNYLIMHGYVKKKAVNTDDLGGITSLSPELSKYEAVATASVMGIDEANGLAKCIIYDITMSGFRMTVAGLWFALHAIFSSDDDEPDELQKANAVEWSFGILGKIVPSWWMYDMMGWGYGLGQAMWCYYKTGDSRTSYNLLVNNLADAFSGNALFDTVDIINEVLTQGETLAQLNDDPNADLSNYKLEPSVYAMEAGAKFLKNITPAFMNAYTKESTIFGTQQRDHTAYKYYDSEGEAKTIEDTNEILMRTLCKNNVAFAWLMDVTKGMHENEYNESTGYFWWEMPVATLTDQVSLIYYNKYNLEDYENMSNEERTLAAQNLLADLEEFGTPAQAIAQGVVIPYAARQNLGRYLESQKDAAYWAYTEAYDAYGWYDDATQDLYRRYKSTKEWVENMQEKFVFNSDIPYGMDRYEKLVTDTEVNYVWTDGPLKGTNASAFDYQTHQGQVEKKYYRTGNASSTLLPFTFVDKTGNYNDEVASAWYDKDYTDKQKIASALGSAEIPMGQDGGSLLLPTISGSQDPFNRDMTAEMKAGRVNSNTFNMPVIGDTGDPFNRSVEASKDSAYTVNTRRVVPSEDNKTITELSDEDKRASAEMAGLDYDALLAKYNEAANSGSSSSSKSSSSYGGSSYSSRSYSSSGGSYSKSYSSSGSSSSSSYRPKIYSSTHNLYTKTAQGMNNNRPYSASTTYLKPGFSTKGSREAYKRSDM